MLSAIGLCFNLVNLVPSFDQATNCHTLFRLEVKSKGLFLILSNILILCYVYINLYILAIKLFVAAT